MGGLNQLNTHPSHAQARLAWAHGGASPLVGSSHPQTPAEVHARPLGLHALARMTQ